jgi:very-short-patch-repair endonuclease
MTEAEVYLWMNIRNRQLDEQQWYRQRIIGDYIVDFYCPIKKLVVEVDGSQHYSAEMLNADAKRDQYLEANGIRVIRFNNDEVLNNIEGVTERILEHL